MRTLAIGDIHGCLTALKELAAYVDFQSDDTVITLGDYVDRGPDSKGVIDFLLHLRTRCRLIPLRGNHEIMMMAARQSRWGIGGWLSVGGDATIDSYGTNFDDVPLTHWDFIFSTRNYYETETHFFVHANVDPKKPLSEQNEDVLFWQPFGYPEPHQSGKIMICGHTSQRTGRPRNLGHAICIDTHVYGKGWLTCLDVATGVYWQTDQRKERRSERLRR